MITKTPSWRIIILKSLQRFKSDAHCVPTEEMNKIALSSNNDKRLQAFDRIITYPYGINVFKICKSEMLNRYESLILIVILMKWKQKHNSKWQYIPDLPYRIWIIRGSGSGKANASLNLINNQLAVGKLLIRWILISTGLKHFNDPKAIIDYSNGVYKNSE